MGNAASDHAALLIVERPYVPSLESQEDVEVIMNIKGEAIVLNQWPARAVAVPAPCRGMLRISVWAVHIDDEEERREVGQILLPHTSLESFEETSLQLWLGLLDPGQVPNSQYPYPEEAQRCFLESLEAAKNPPASKVCITVASIRPELADGRAGEKEMLEVQRLLSEKPIMQLLSHTGDIIRNLSRQYMKATRDLRCLNREFRSKETMYQGFVKVEKANKDQMLQMLAEKSAQMAAKSFENAKHLACVHCFGDWKLECFTASLDRLKQKLDTASDSSKQRMMQFANKKFSNEDRLALLGHIMQTWTKQAKQWTKKMKFIHRMIPQSGHLALEMVWHRWKQVMPQQEREQPARVGVDFTIKGLDYGMLSGDMDLMQILVVHVKESVMKACKKEGHETVNSSSIKVAIHERHHATRVQTIISTGSSTASSLLKQKLDDKLKAVGTDLGTTLIGVPGIFSMCSGPISIAELTTTYVRGDTEMAHRIHLADKFEKSLFFYHSKFVLLEEQLIFRSWYSLHFQESEKKSMDQDLEDRMNAAALREERQNAKHEAAKKSVELMVRKWEMGNTAGLVVEVFSTWHKYTAKWVAKRQGQAAVKASLHKFLEGDRVGVLHTAYSSWSSYTAKLSSTRKQKASVKMAMMKFLEGEKRGLIHGTFAQWEAHKNYAKMHGWQDDKLDKHQKEMKDFLSDERARLEEDHAKTKQDLLDQKHAAVQHCLKSWEQGETNAIREQTFTMWRTYAHHACEKARQRQSVHDALLSAIMGEARAGLQMCFTNWAHETKHNKTQRLADEAARQEAKKYEDFVNEMKDGHGKELERHLTDAQKRKEQAHEMVLMMLKKSLLGETKGLLTSVFFEWNRFKCIQKELEKRHEAAKLSVMSWLEGAKKAAVHLGFTHWVHFHKTEKVHRHAQELQERLDAQIAAHGSKVGDAELRAQRAKKNVELALRKWSAGNTQGLIVEVYTTWHKEASKNSSKARQAASVQVCMQKWIAGDKLGLLQFTWKGWHIQTSKQLAFFRERSAAQDSLRRFLEGETRGILHSTYLMWEAAWNNAKLHGWHSERQAQAKQEREDHLAALHKKYQDEAELRASKHLREMQSKHGAVVQAICRQFEGDARAAQNLCFISWASHAKAAKASASWQNFADEQKSGLGKELERLQTDAERKKEQAHEATSMMLKKWMLGETKGLQSSVCCEWKRYVEIQADLQRRHEATKASVLAWVEGADKAMVQLCITHWVHYKEQQELHRAHCDVQANLDALGDKHLDDMAESEKRHEAARLAVEMSIRKFLLGNITALNKEVLSVWHLYTTKWNAKRREQAAVQQQLRKFMQGEDAGNQQICLSKWHKFVAAEIALKTQRAAVRDQLRQFLEGELRGLQDTCFKEWNHFVEICKHMNGAEASKSQLEEQKRLHDLKVAKKKEAMIAAMESMGFKNNKTTLEHHFLLWSAAHLEIRGQRASAQTKTSWRNASLHCCRKYVEGLEARVRIISFLRWRRDFSRRQARRNNRLLHESTVARSASVFFLQENRKVLLSWKAAASQQRSLNFALEKEELQIQARDFETDSLLAMNKNDSLRTSLAVNLLAAEQRAEDALEFSDKLGIVTGTLQGEMRTHNLTLDALEHEVLLLEAQMTGPDLYRWKRGISAVETMTVVQQPLSLVENPAGYL